MKAGWLTIDKRAEKLAEKHYKLRLKAVIHAIGAHTDFFINHLCEKDQYN